MPAPPKPSGRQESAASLPVRASHKPQGLPGGSVISSNNPSRPQKSIGILSGPGSGLPILEEQAPNTGSIADIGRDLSTANECFRLRQVNVDGLLQDGTLGLLLHGTSVVGFCSDEAAEFGWLVGDQIVEVNGQRVGVFDEFLEKFLAAQVAGFPILFSVLRREAANSAEEELEDPLESFFSQTDFVDLVDQMKNKFGTTPEGEQALAAAMEGETSDDSILDNPYIQALVKRRTELSRSSEDWIDDTGCQSLPARMAIERDALASLSRTSTDTPRRFHKGAHGSASPVNIMSDLDLPAFCMNSAGRPCGDGDSPGYEITPTPRVADCEVERQSSWPGFESASDFPIPAAVSLTAGSKDPTNRS
eukprot:TRINITY_DN62447_c0_g1_i1.p1 TRINITY_DN62447_c0_g1~~TRINITY_DN62447_c0_g1_i1.p1  ORF type:complete len:363 (+),score=71.52 TRINITY_DN62447_c0_g1_i1:109-1197(+)